MRLTSSDGWAESNHQTDTRFRQWGKRHTKPKIPHGSYHVWVSTSSRQETEERKSCRRRPNPARTAKVLISHNSRAHKPVQQHTEEQNSAARLAKCDYHSTNKERRPEWVWQLARDTAFGPRQSVLQRSVGKNPSGSRQPTTSRTSRLQTRQVMQRSNIYIKTNNRESQLGRGRWWWTSLTL